MAFVPDDLRDVSTPDTDKNYFKIVITDLELLTTYPLQFRWQYEDKTYSDWSAVKNVTTIGESVDVPSQPIASAGYGRIIITWDGNNSAGSPLTNIDRINVYIGDVYYGSIFAKGFTGRLSVALPSGTYVIKFKAVSKLGKESSFSASTTVTFSNGVEEAYTDLQNKLTAGGGVIANPDNQQIVSINTGSGLIVYASSGTETTGNRVILNAEGLAGFKSDGKSSFAILTNTKYYDPTTQIMYSTNASGRETIDAGTGFFNGYIYAQGGKLVNNLTIATNMKLGANITDPNNPAQTVDGIVIDANNYWYVGGKFRVGSGTGSLYYMDWDTSVLTIRGNITASTITGGTIRTAASGTRIQLTSTSTNTISFYNTYNTESVGAISVGSDGIYMLPPGSTHNAFVVYGPNGAIPNGAAFLNQVRLTPDATINSNTTADLTSHRLRNMIVSESDPSTASGGAGTSGGYGSIWLTREA